MPRVVADVTSNVQQIAVGPEGSPGQYPPNVFLITGSSGAVFVDTAYGNDDEVETALDACRLGFATIVIAEAISAVDLEPGDGERALAAIREAGATIE